MTVWLCIPSKKPVYALEAALSAWKYWGYQIAVFRDEGDAPPRYADMIIRGEYQGYAKSVNELCRTVTSNDRGEAKWFVTGGDDVSPPSMNADKIAGQCTQHFEGTLGIMQPTGDRWLERNGVASAERACVSPWMGREWVLRGYGGVGPLWPEYYHFYVDNDLQEVAKKLGILWQRPDLTMKHDHWIRRGEVIHPPYMNKAADMNASDGALFRKRKAEGFPGCEPLIEAVHD